MSGSKGINKNGYSEYTSISPMVINIKLSGILSRLEGPTSANDNPMARKATEITTRRSTFSEILVTKTLIGT
jgi:hypothetical protein